MRMSAKKDIGRVCLIRIDNLDIYLIGGFMYRLNDYWKLETLLPYQGPCELVFLWTLQYKLTKNTLKDN
jgi:hypothetical protein